MKLVRLALLLTVTAGAMRGDAQSLRGLQGVGVFVEPLTAEAERAGLHAVDIQTDVELKLRLAGIRVLTKEEIFQQSGSPHLYINANVQLSAGGQSTFHYALSCQLQQFVTLARDASISTLASTWDESTVGLISARRLPEVRGDVKELIDLFLNAYLSVNPRK